MGPRARFRLLRGILRQASVTAAQRTSWAWAQFYGPGAGRGSQFGVMGPNSGPNTHAFGLLELPVGPSQQWDPQVLLKIIFYDHDDFKIIFIFSVCDNNLAHDKILKIFNLCNPPLFFLPRGLEDPAVKG